jgi:tetratricopeptide (TPR) repeat protein
MKQDNTINENKLQEKLEFIAQHRRNEPTKAIQMAQYALELAQKLHNKHAECTIHNYIGGINLQRGNLELGKQHLFYALEIYNKHLKDLELLARIKLGIGSYFFDIADYENALLHFLKALQYDIQELKPAIYNNIASVYLKLEHYEQAFKYLFEGLKISEEHKDNDRRIFFLYNIGSAYHFRQEYEKAVDYYNQTTEAIEQIQGYQYMKCLCLARIGIVKCDLGAFEQSFAFFDKALEISLKHDLHRERIRIIRRKGEAFLKINNIDAFLSFHEDSIKQAERFDLPQESLDSYKNLKEYYKTTEQFDKAFEYAEIINELQNKIFSKDRDSKIAQLADEKKHEIELLERKNEFIAAQNQILERTNKMLEEFAYVVAHDLREPLRSIISFTNLLERHNANQLDKTSSEFMHYIVSSAKHMN